MTAESRTKTAFITASSDTAPHLRELDHSKHSPRCMVVVGGCDTRSAGASIRVLELRRGLNLSRVTALTPARRPEVDCGVVTPVVPGGHRKRSLPQLCGVVLPPSPRGTPAQTPGCTSHHPSPPSAPHVTSVGPLLQELTTSFFDDLEEVVVVVVAERLGSLKFGRISLRKKSQKIRHRFPQIRANRKQIKTPPC